MNQLNAYGLQESLSSMGTTRSATIYEKDVQGVNVAGLRRHERRETRWGAPLFTSSSLAVYPYLIPILNHVLHHPLECVGRIVVEVCPDKKGPAFLGPPPAIGLGLECEGVLGRVGGAERVKANTADESAHRARAPPLALEARLDSVLADGGGGVAGAGDTLAVRSLWRLVLQVGGDQSVGAGVGQGERVAVAHVVYFGG